MSGNTVSIYRPLRELREIQDIGHRTLTYFVTLEYLLKSFPQRSPQGDSTGIQRQRTLPTLVDEHRGMFSAYQSVKRITWIRNDLAHAEHVATEIDCGYACAILDDAILQVATYCDDDIRRSILSSEMPRVGHVYLGRVVRCVEFGAFVEITPERDGLLRKAEISDRAVESVRAELNEGDRILVQVITVSGEKIEMSRRIVLSALRRAL